MAALILDWFRTLRAKLVLLAAALMLVISLFILLIIPSRLGKQATNAAIDKATNIAIMTAYSVGPALVFGDLAETESALNGAIQVRDVAYVVLADENGDIFAAINKEQADRLGYRRADSGNQVANDHTVYLLATPVISNRREVGRLYLGLSLNEINREIQRTRLSIALLSLVIFGFGLAAMAGISTVLTTPLRRIAGVTEQISRGDLNQRAIVGSRDEIGSLATSFNRMVDSLVRARGELEHVNSNLEAMVTARTRELKLEVQERIRAESSLIQREAILEAVNSAAETLIRRPDLQQGILQILEVFGKATQTSQVFACKNISSDTHPLSAACICDWSQPQTKPQTGKPWYHLYSWNAGGLGRWKETLERGDIIVGLTRELLQSEQLTLAPFNVKSVLVVPVFSGDTWWGMVGFQDCAAERNWNSGEIDAIRTGATILGAAIKHQQAEEARRESEMLFRSIVENSHDGIVIIDDSFRIVYLNDEMAAIAASSREEVLGKDFRLFIAADSKALVTERYLRRQRGEDLPNRYEIELERPDGELRQVEMSSSVIKDPRGRIRTLAQILDITEKKKLHLQFLQSQKMEAIGRLAGGVAHDFNNLLTVVLGNADIGLSKLDLDDPIRKEFEEITGAARRASDLTKQLLAFSRKQALEPRIVDLNTVITGLDRMMRRLIGEDIDLQTVPKAGLWNVKVDPGQIEQVIVNLVINARDAMPGGGKLTIETGNVELDDTYARTHPPTIPGSYVMLAVSDSGVGMTGEVRSRIFEPFFTTKELGKGTGLGLATVYGIIKQSSGYIWVYSEVGQGTTFKIYLPMVTGIAEEYDLKPIDEVDLRGTETVLVVEDEDSVRRLTSLILRMYGYKVIEAHDGMDGLTIASDLDKPVDIVVTDIVMPRMSGVEMVQELYKRWGAFKLLYISGYTANAIMHDGAIDPGTPYLQKPFRVIDFVRKVRDLLDA